MPSPIAIPPVHTQEPLPVHTQEPCEPEADAGGGVARRGFWGPGPG